MWIVDITIKALKSVISGRLNKWIFGSISSVSFIVSFGKNYFGEKSILHSAKWGILLCISLYIIVFLSYFIWHLIYFIHRTFRETTFGEGIITLKKIISTVQSLNDKEYLEDKDFMEGLISICNELNDHYEKKTKSKCSVSIKVPKRGILSADTSVTNLCRDSEARKIRDTEEYKQKDHSIVGNTAYVKITNKLFSGKAKGGYHYLNNDIRSSSDYDNTSLDVYSNGKLPYNSELVHPIIQEHQKGDKDCRGFICIDSEKREVFDELYDPPIISIVAAQLHCILHKRELDSIADNKNISDGKAEQYSS